MALERAVASDSCSIQKFNGPPPKDTQETVKRTTVAPVQETKIEFQPTINFKEEI